MVRQTEKYEEDLAHTIAEVEKSHSSPAESWRARKPVV